MNEDSRKYISSQLEIQSAELNDEQLDEVTGGTSHLTIRLNPYNRRCAANPAHGYYAYNPDDVCPFCGAKEFIVCGST